MRIEQISATIDQKLNDLDERLRVMQEQQIQNPSSVQAESIQSLSALRVKLEKSKALAWQAHHLQHGSNEAARQRQQYMGLALCGISLVGAIVLITVIAIY